MQLSSSVLQGPETQWSRRSFLAAAAGGISGIAAWNQLDARLTSGTIATSRPAKHVIFINLVGGPSQIDTWDPKPAASSDIRNFDPACATSIPGVSISENLPRMAQRMHLVSLIRSVHHSGPATHAAGQQLLMTGRCFFHNEPAPYFGSVVSQVLARQPDRPTNVVLGGRLTNEFVDEAICQDGAWLSPEHNPHFANERSSESPFRRTLDLLRESHGTRECYGFHDLGRMCLQARRLIESGARTVTINHFTSVLDRATWDMHANGGRLNSTAIDYRNHLCPQLDQALSGLLDDLADRGLLSESVVAVCGEMGRSPRINRYGGRDHHTEVWSGLLVGGPIRAGQVIGESDAQGGYPISRPVSPAEFCATIYVAIGIEASRTAVPGPDVHMVPVLDAEPIHELL